MQTVAQRQKVERKIARRLLTDLIAAGYLIDINDDDAGDGDVVISRSTDVEACLAVMFSTDGDLVVASKPGGTVSEQIGGWVRLIYGNDGYDVICDYTTNLEPVLGPVNAYADTLDKRN